MPFVLPRIFVDIRTAAKEPFQIDSMMELSGRFVVVSMRAESHVYTFHAPKKKAHTHTQKRIPTEQTKTERKI